MTLISDRPAVVFEMFTDLLRDEGIADVDRIADLARASVSFLHQDQVTRGQERAMRVLEDYWYAALDVGFTDFGVYSSPLYLSEAWACWAVYSRGYLRSIDRPEAREVIGPVERVVDVGCGVGLTTAALSEMFPGAAVVGTNLPGPQERLAQRLARRYGFEVVPEPRSMPVDLVFASEYFEHFPAPIEHLKEVLDAARPRALVVANTFNAASTGHFPRYAVGGDFIDGRATARAFGNEMRERGYQKADLSFWNARPTVWVKP